MAYGIVGYSQANAINQPSGAIWGDCSSQELLDEASGFFVYTEFKSGATLPGLPNVATDSGAFSYNASFDSVCKFTSGGTQSDDILAFTKPVGPITPGSGKTVWFEAAVSAASISVAHGVFVGLANAKALAAGKLISAASVTKASNTLGSTDGESFVGFWMHGDAVTNFDAVWGANTTAALTPTTVNVVLASVLTANANNPNPANPSYTPPAPPGALIATTGTQSNLEAGTAGFVKLGLRYDGKQYIYFYVNGTQVAKLVVDKTFDITSNFGGVVCIAAGSAAAAVLNVQFIRCAAKVF